jgi:hypothetical protein
MKEIGYKRNERGYGAFFLSTEDLLSLHKLNPRTKMGKPVDIFFKTVEIFGKEIWRFEVKTGYYPSELSFAEILVDNMECLLENGFTMTSYAQKQYDYCKGKAEENILAREQERERKKIAEELAKKQKEEEMQKALANSPLKIPFCDKYGCKTSYSSCIRCKMRQYGCSYRLVAVK